MRSTRKLLVASLAQAGVIAAFVMATPAALAAEVVSPAPSELAAIKQKLAEQSRVLAEQQRQLAADMMKLEAHKQALEASQQRLESLQKQLGMASDERRADDSELLVSGGQSEGGAQDVPEVDVGALFGEPTILTPRGRFVFEPSLQYSYYSSDRVSIVGYTILPALVIGLIDVRSVKRDTWIAAATLRYGLTNRWELEAKVPYVYREDDTLSRPVNLEPSAENRLFSSDGNGLGDIELAARYQLNLPRGNDPFYIAGLRFKARNGTDPFEVDYSSDTTSANAFGTFQTELPTGSGFYSLQPSLSAVLATDPAVFYGGINYLWNMKRDVNKTVAGNPVGEIDPGDSVGINLGMGLGLNEKSSFSLGYEHTWIGEAEVDTPSSSASTSTQLASLLLGFSYQLSKTTNFNLTIGAGLTDDTPDTQITVRLPIRL
jgi:nucleoid-associated protein YgaU